MSHNQKSQPPKNSKPINDKNGSENELKQKISKFREVCQDYAEDNDELIAQILQEFNYNLEESIAGAILGITKHKSQGSWQQVGGGGALKKTNQNQGNKYSNNNNNNKNKGRNSNRDGKQRGNSNYKGPRDKKNNIQSNKKRETPKENMTPPPVADTPSEIPKSLDNIAQVPQQVAQAAPAPQQVQPQQVQQHQHSPQVFISQSVKHENYASAVKRGVQQQLLAKESAKPPNIPQAQREEPLNVPVNNAQNVNSNVSQAPVPVSQAPQQPPQQHTPPQSQPQAQPQHTPQPQPQQPAPSQSSVQQVTQHQAPPQKSVEIPEPEQHRSIVVPQQANPVQLPKTQTKQEVSTNVGIGNTKNVILPGGLFEDEQIEIQFGNVAPIPEKSVDNSIKENQSNNQGEENLQENQKQQVPPIFSDVNNTPNLEGAHYEQDMGVPPMIPYYGLPQNQPYPPYVVDQERHMYVDPSYSYRDAKYNQRSSPYRGDAKFPGDSSAPNVPQQGSTPSQPTGHPNQHNVYQPFPVFSPMYGLPYNPPASGYPYPPRFMYYPSYAGTNVNTGMGYPTEEEYKIYQGMPNAYYPSESVPKNPSKGNQSNNKSTYQDPSGQPSSGAFKGNQQLNQPEFKSFRDPSSSYYGNINPTFNNYPPNPQGIQNTGYQRQQ